MRNDTASEGYISRGLIIKPPWINLILSGEKSLEMRSRFTKIRGTIALIRSGSGMIVGHCKLTDCKQLTSAQLKVHYNEHRIKDDNNLLVKYRWAWCLTDAKPFRKPIPYRHPRGAITWVDLSCQAVFVCSRCGEHAPLALDYQDFASLCENCYGKLY